MSDSNSDCGQQSCTDRVSVKLNTVRFGVGLRLAIPVGIGGMLFAGLSLPVAARAATPEVAIAATTAHRAETGAVNH